jgi:hypothetical protein
MIEEYKNKYIGFTEKIIDLANQKDLRKYLDIVRDPINKISFLDTIQKTIVLLLMFTLIFEIIPAIISITISSIFNIMAGVLLVPALITLGTVCAIVIIAGVLNILIYTIYAALEYIVVKILNGAGNLKEHISISLGSLLTMYILSIPLTIITAILTILEGIPFFEIVTCILFLPIFILGLLQLIVGLYGVYIKIVMVKELHNFDTGKALIAILTPLFVILTLTVIVVATLVFFFSFTLAGITALQQQVLPNLMI